MSPSAHLFAVRRRLVVALALAAFFGAAARARGETASCEPPAWFRQAALSIQTKDLIGVGRGPKLAHAMRAARGDIGREIARTRGAEILNWPLVAPKLNQQIYAQSDLLRALAPAIALALPDLRRVHSETVCQVLFIAGAAPRAETLAQLAADTKLAERLNAVLAGHLDALEQQRETERTARSSLKKDLAPVAKTIQRLDAMKNQLATDDFFESMLIAPLGQRADKLRGDLKLAQSLDWEEDRPKVLAWVQKAAFTEEKLLAAVANYRQKNYVNAAEGLRALARERDETAQFALALLLLDARTGAADDAEATTWLEKAAQSGHGPARMLMGFLRLSSRHERPSASEANKWFQSAMADGWTCSVEVVQCTQKKPGK